MFLAQPFSDWRAVPKRGNSCEAQNNVLLFKGHKPLSSLPLVCLGVLERKSTGPLIRTRLPANPAITARKQNAPECNSGKEARANRSKAEGENASLCPHAVSIERKGDMIEGSYRECREGIRCFGIGC